jgi:hypothetical protein
MITGVDCGAVSQKVTGTLAGCVSGHANICKNLM